MILPGRCPHRRRGSACTAGRGRGVGGRGGGVIGLVYRTDTAATQLSSWGYCPQLVSKLGKCVNIQRETRAVLQNAASVQDVITLPKQTT